MAQIKELDSLERVENCTNSLINQHISIFVTVMRTWFVNVWRLISEEYQSCPRDNFSGMRNYYKSCSWNFNNLILKIYYMKITMKVTIKYHNMIFKTFLFDCKDINKTQDFQSSGPGFTMYYSSKYSQITSLVNFFQMKMDEQRKSGPLMMARQHYKVWDTFTKLETDLHFGIQFYYRLQY